MRTGDRQDECVSRRSAEAPSDRTCFVLTLAMKCPPCKGTGKQWQWGTSFVECEVCHGEGILADTRIHLPVCHFCNGTGMEHGVSLSVLCPKCEGWGRRERKPFDLTENVGPSVVFVEAGKPRTAHLELSAFLTTMSGHIRICDPYYGTGSLYRLDELRDCKPIQFLTHTPDGKEKSFLPKALGDFIRERPDVEFRRHRGRELHDRFVLTADELILLGHGLKDIGNRDSFVVRLDRTIAGDMIDTVRRSFDRKWQQADPLP